MFDALKKYAVFSGRAGKREFWLFTVLYTIVMIAAGIIDGILFNRPEYVDVNVTVNNNPAGDDIINVMIDYADHVQVLGILAFFGLIIPSFAVAVRRLHDFNARGWWSLLYFIPFINIIAFFVIGLTGGTDGKNRFGPKPKQAKR